MVTIIIMDDVISMTFILGTGKSYTIEGDNTESVRGVIPRASEDIYKCTK